MPKRRRAKSPAPGGSGGGRGVRRAVQASARDVRVKLRREDVRQLALDLRDHLAPAPTLTFAELSRAWLRDVASKHVRPKDSAWQARQLQALWATTEATLTPALIEALFAKLEARLGACSLNKVRSVGVGIVRYAKACRVWPSANPFEETKRRDEKQRVYELLTPPELRLVQRKLPPARRWMFRVALHLGMRPGELFALRKADVDFRAGVVHVRRSHGRDTTKTGIERVVPLLAAIRLDLRRAINASPSELVFPGQDGRRQRSDTKLSEMLHVAMARAGVGVVATKWKCRRKGCGFTETTKRPWKKRGRRRCPKCTFVLWAVPKVRSVPWYNLRHMAITYHHAAGADVVCLSRAMGHAVRVDLGGLLSAPVAALTTTQTVYTHPTLAKIRRELSKWRLSR